MIKPDVIVCWPRNTDYPIWRQMIRDNRDRFNQVIIVFTETNQGIDYRPFIREAMAMDHVAIVDSPAVKSEEDWRDVAVKYGLYLYVAGSPWVWFTEQDFYPRPGFWETVEQKMQDESVGSIQIKDEERIHPACAFIRGDVLSEVTKDFGIVPNQYDHFYRFFQDVDRVLEEKKLQKVILSSILYNHMAGLSHNLRLIADGGEPNYKPEEFKTYMESSLKVWVPLSEQYWTLGNNYLKKGTQ